MTTIEMAAADVKSSPTRHGKDRAVSFFTRLRTASYSVSRHWQTTVLLNSSQPEIILCTSYKQTPTYTCPAPKCSRLSDKTRTNESRKSGLSYSASRIIFNKHTKQCLTLSRGVGGTVASEFALRSAGTLLSLARAPLPAPWPDGGPEKPEITLLWTCYIQITNQPSSSSSS
ncbi:hypothetical protein PoB_004684400 [Plakobranchus ocellatus]|uniref:Uncharacterized protein n=1 Tax=Plakobranchus ocellatus TaxID=259542 RepID=A0AAV4BPU2_9GAST|nr:hypothetical protein PoB_004684400 [Plakobranchus ocellatus]